MAGGVLELCSRGRRERGQNPRRSRSLDPFPAVTGHFFPLRHELRTFTTPLFSPLASTLGLTYPLTYP